MTDAELQREKRRVRNRIAQLRRRIDRRLSAARLGANAAGWLWRRFGRHFSSGPGQHS